MSSGKNAYIQFYDLVAADAHHFALLQHAQRFGLEVQVHFADLIRKMVPPSASSNLPILRVIAPVKAPFHDRTARFRSDRAV